MRLLHGRPIAERINAKTKERVAALASRGVTPTLAIVSAGDFPDARTYRWRIAKLAKDLGIAESERAYPHVDEAQLAAHLERGTGDAHGVLVLTPLPPNISEDAIASQLLRYRDGKATIGQHDRHADDVSGWRFLACHRVATVCHRVRRS